MAQGVAGHVGLEQDFEALGRRWHLARWTRAVWDDILAWAKTVLVDPRQAAADNLKLYPNKPEYEDVRRIIVLQGLADARAYLTPGSPDVMRLLDTLDGTCKVFELLLKPAHPAVTGEDVYALLLSLGADRIKAMLMTAAGAAPKGEAGASPASPP